MTTPYINPNLIFAENAPTQDKPAAFQNYDKGMDETRRNEGRPLIPEMNYLHQKHDLQNLYIHENGAALPYKDGIAYEENAVVVKDGVLQQWKDGEWVTDVVDLKNVDKIDTKLKRENVSVWDFFTASEYAAYKAAPSTFDAYRPLQEFFNYISANDVHCAYCNADLRTSQGITYGAGNALTKMVVGDFVLRALNAIDVLFNINAGQDFFWSGKIAVVGTGSTGSYSYASRTCRIGFQLSATGMVSSRNKFTAITANNFYETGISIPTAGSLSSMGFLRASNCGSGKINAGYSLTSTFSFIENLGNASSTSQSTRIGVSVLPPENIATSPSAPIMVIIDEQPYYIYEIDRTAKTLRIFPFLDSNITSGNLRYFFGGGVFINGGDSSVLSVDMIDAINCSSAYTTGALYPANVDRVVSQYNEAAVVLGQNPSSAMLGGNIGTLYCENNTFDLIRVTRAQLSFNILNNIAFNFNKVAYTTAPRNAANNRVGWDNFNGISFGMNGQFVEWERIPSRDAEGAGVKITTEFDSDFIYCSGGASNPSIGIASPDLNLIQHFGKYKRRVIVYGDGVNGAPLGSVTFNLADSANYTINRAGNTSETFISGDGMAVFEIVYRHETKRFYITAMNTKQPQTSLTYDPPSLNAAGTGGDSVTTTVTLTGAVVGSVVQAAFSQYNAYIEISAAVSAANTVTVKFKNTGAAAVDLASGTLTVKLI